MNTSTISNILGLLLIINGCFMLLGLPFSFYFGSDDIPALLLSGCGTMFFGFILWFFTRNRSKEIKKKEGYLIVSIGWVAMSLFGALPFIIHGCIPNYTDAFFETISGFTTTGATGFVTADYTSWIPFLTILFFVLMFVGGSAGSTGGGIKVIRFLLLFKNSFIELKRLLHPRAIIPVRLNSKSISSDIITNVLAFFLLYVIVFVFGSIVMAILGLDFLSSIGSVAACIGNIGPGIGSIISPIFLTWGNGFYHF